MAVFTGQIKSKVLDMDVGLCVILPHDRTDKELKVLYLLHGLSDGCTAWTRFTRIESYATKKGYIVIMPEVHRSFYTNMVYGGQYAEYILEELPDLCKKMFGISRNREKTYIAGLSMGGYGAMKCAFTKPEQYKGCAALSAVCDIKARLEGAIEIGDHAEIYAIVGKEGKAKAQDDLYLLSKRVIEMKQEQQPELFIACGTEDFLYEDNKKWVNYLNQIGYKFTYIEQGGNHDWDFWDDTIQKAINFFESL